jgi:hypothetical protein
MKKILLVIVFVFSFTSIVQAREVLNIVFVFDTTTTHYSSDNRNNESQKLIDKLNLSFFKSGLSSKIYFQRVAYIPRPVSKKGETLQNIQTRYNSNRSGLNKRAKLSLHYVQKAYKADIVVTIMNPKKSSLCGISMPIPETINGLKYGDNGFVFISNQKGCMDSPTLIAHEVGHTFGLHHGKAVADDRSDSRNYKPNSLSNGYGVLVDYGMNYSTIMSRDIVFSEKGIRNSFSNPNKYKCGFWDSDKNHVCGNSTANATKFISNNVRFYNMRGDWYNN